MDGTGGEGPDQQSCGAGDPMGAGAVPRAVAGRRRRQPSLDGSASAAQPGRRRAMTATVQIGNVTKHYGRIAAVTDVSFELGEGEMVALIGHNGAGKTTLMKLMLGLIRPTGGSILVLGDNPAAGQFAGRRHLGYLPENVSFDAALTGRETQTFYARLKRERVAKALQLLDAVGLGAAASRRVGTYSKGMRQRLGLAQALIGRPQFFFNDAATT